MISPDRRQTWNEFMTDYSNYFIDDTWNNRLEDVKTYMDIHHVRPIHATPETIRLDLWIHHQQQNYKNRKYSMVLLNRREAWETFMANYINYF